MSPARACPRLVGCFTLLLFVSPPAFAFERQWHLGGGVGAAFPSNGYDLGPALALHGAYGISDVFDLRLELQGSRNDFQGTPVSFYGARLGLAYKIDIIEWIPYIGVSGGSFGVVWSESFVLRPSAGAFFGLDYAVSRHFGLGVLAVGDIIIANPSVTVGAVLLRAEYRFGW